jgi:hypothetical protein
VSADTQPPALGAFTLTAATLPASGGTVTASLGATDDRAVTSVLLVLKHPDGHEGGGRMALSGGTAANGTWSLSWTVPANATDQPVTYQVRASAADSARNTATSPTQTITVAAHKDAGPLLLQKPKVP